jgi:hypothetical protein
MINAIGRIGTSGRNAMTDPSALNDPSASIGPNGLIDRNGRSDRSVRSVRSGLAATRATIAAMTTGPSATVPSDLPATARAFHSMHCRRQSALMHRSPALMPRRRQQMMTPRGHAAGDYGRRGLMVMATLHPPHEPLTAM